MTLPTTPLTRFGMGTYGQRRWPRSRVLATAGLALALVAVGMVPAQAQAAKAKAKTTKTTKEAGDPREMQAREAYAAGSYKDALDIYAKLYAEKLHPTYLRNIGRCYQNLGQPDRAISSFREYLRKAKDLPADERTEVEGYIKEMEDMQKKGGDASPVPAQPLPPAPPVQPLPPPQPVMILQQPPSPAPAPESPPPFYKRAWFWGVVGGVVVAGTVAGLWAGGVFSTESNNECRPGFTCIGGTSP